MYKEVVRPFLDSRDSETWHVRAREALHLAEISPLTLFVLEKLFAYHGKRYTNERLNVVLGKSITLDNPLMVGAGWDKVGRTVKAWHRLGFAGIEIGAVLPREQTGNSKPRQFMLTPEVCINRLGFNSPGMQDVFDNLEKYVGSDIPVGINLGINKDTPPTVVPGNFAAVARYMYPCADYFTINVSSPNTPGLRQLQDKKPLTDIVKEVNKAMDGRGKRKPLFVKIAPELTKEDIDNVIQVVVDNGLTGIVATNTTTNPDIKAKYGEKWRNEAGGLSGNDVTFRGMTIEKIAHIYNQTKGKIEIIGVGGVSSTNNALEKIAAGATVIQVVTGIRTEGTTLPGRINRGIVQWMDEEGVKKITDIIGVKARVLAG